MNDHNQRKLVLSRALAEVVSPDRVIKDYGTARSERLASAIMADPHWLLDLLVAARVIGRASPTSLWYYTPAQVRMKHVHEWHIDPSEVGVLNVKLRCDCGVSTWVKNKLPIVVPG